MKTIEVSASKKYPVVIGSGLLDRIGEYAGNIKGIASAAVITDDIVDRFYGQRVCNALSQKGYKVFKYCIENGEKSKNTENFVKILNFLAEHRLNRTDAVFALGGGVVGDLAGFAAAAFLRGVRFIQLPTTLLAAVDSSVGGKTAVNLEKGKNLAGAFYQPNLVLCDTGCLSTLPHSVFTDGCAEVIKYGVIADSHLFRMLKKDIKSDFEDIISRCVEIKGDVVCGDEFESGRRQILNFGHTVGHAVELCSNYEIPHGNAVAIGMAVISAAAAKKGFCSRDCALEITALIEKYNLPVSCGFSHGQLYNAVLSDKKRAGDHITLVLPLEIGRCVLQKVSVSELEDFIKLGLSQL